MANGTLLELLQQMAANPSAFVPPPEPVRTTPVAQLLEQPEPITGGRRVGLSIANALSALGAGMGAGTQQDFLGQLQRRRQAAADRQTQINLAQEAQRVRQAEREQEIRLGREAEARQVFRSAQDRAFEVARQEQIRTEEQAQKQQEKIEKIQLQAGLARADLTGIDLTTPEGLNQAGRRISDAEALTAASAKAEAQSEQARAMADQTNQELGLLVFGGRDAVGNEIPDLATAIDLDKTDEEKVATINNALRQLQRLSISRFDEQGLDLFRRLRAEMLRIIATKDPRGAFDVGPPSDVFLTGATDTTTPPAPPPDTTVGEFFGGQASPGGLLGALARAGQRANVNLGGFGSIGGIPRRR